MPCQVTPQALGATEHNSTPTAVCSKTARAVNVGPQSPRKSCGLLPRLEYRISRQRFISAGALRSQAWWQQELAVCWQCETWTSAHPSRAMPEQVHRMAAAQLLDKCNQPYLLHLGIRSKASRDPCFSNQPGLQPLLTVLAVMQRCWFMVYVVAIESSPLPLASSAS